MPPDFVEWFLVDLSVALPWDRVGATVREWSPQMLWPRLTLITYDEAPDALLVPTQAWLCLEAWRVDPGMNYGPVPTAADIPRGFV